MRYTGNIHIVGDKSVILKTHWVICQCDSNKQGEIPVDKRDNIMILMNTICDVHPALATVSNSVILYIAFDQMSTIV